LVILITRIKGELGFHSRETPFDFFLVLIVSLTVGVGRCVATRNWKCHLLTPIFCLFSLMGLELSERLHWMWNVIFTKMKI